MWTLVKVPLPVGQFATPMDRLHAAKKAADALKATPSVVINRWIAEYAMFTCPVLTDGVRAVGEYLPYKEMAKLATNAVFSATMLFTNVVGPQKPVYFAGTHTLCSHHVDIVVRRKGT